MRGSTGAWNNILMRWAIGLLLAFGLLLGSVNVFLPHILVNKAHAALKESCPSCQLEIGTLRVNAFSFPTHFTVRNFRLNAPSEKDEGYELSAEEIDAWINPFSFLSEAPTVESIDARVPHVTVRERKGSPPGKHAYTPAPGAALAGFPKMRVNGIRISDGKFSYVETVPNPENPNQKAAQAKLDVTRINATVDSFVTRADLLTPRYQHKMNAQATAKLEDQGDVDFSFSFDPFAVKNHDVLDISVRNLSLSNINSFFKNDSGMELSGTLHEAVTHIEMSEGQIHGMLNANYNNLSVKFDKTPERGKLSSAIMSWFATAKVTKDRPSPGKSATPTPLSTAREPYEPITKWILRSLSDAAKKTITS